VVHSIVLLAVAIALLGAMLSVSVELGKERNDITA
jgi:hypothetical protein